jgi:hypothetical protein
MPHYRYSGMFSFAPDRGSPNGGTSAFSEEFEADSDSKARIWVGAYKSTHQKILRARLVRIVERENTERVPL